MGVMGHADPGPAALFSGDTGYFDGFKEIGRKLGPFDLAAVAIGAYVPPEIMKTVHTTPEEAVQNLHRSQSAHFAWHSLGHL